MPTNPIIKHQHQSETLNQHLIALLGVTTSTPITITARSTVAHPFVVTTAISAGSLGWGVKTMTYSYDGVIHIDSYRSDI